MEKHLIGWVSFFNYTIGAKSFELGTKDSSVNIVKEIITAHRAPGIIDTDLDSSLSGVFFRIIREVCKLYFSNSAVRKCGS